MVFIASFCNLSVRTIRSKFQSLTLKNVSGRPRRLTVAAYVEWVLGASRTVTAPHIITELDPETGALFAYNPWTWILASASLLPILPAGKPPGPAIGLNLSGVTAAWMHR